jgi:hypothetical protein
LPLVSANPHYNDRSPQWIYPNLIDSDTSLSLIGASLGLEEAIVGDRAVTVSIFEPIRLAQRTLGLPRFLGPLPPLLSRRIMRSAASEVPSTHRSSQKEKRLNAFSSILLFSFQRLLNRFPKMR